MIIGGGASGLATAIMLKQKAPKLNIAIFEQLDRVGKKISVTGNGRCNITNLSINAQNFHSKNTNKAINIINSFTLEDTISFFSSIGVEICFEGNKAFPRSFQASSVVDALRFSAENLGVHTFSSVKILNITKKGEIFCIKTDNNGFNPDMLKAKAMVIATGGLAGGSKLGSNGDGYRFLNSFGHNILPQSPVIVQVKTENHITKTLKGIKVNAEVSVLDNNKTISKDFGEVLFCDYGLSGPPVYQLSRYCKSGCTIALDLFKELSYEELSALLIKRVSIFKGQPLTEFFAGLLHKRLGQAVLKQSGLTLSSGCDTITKNDISNIASVLKAYEFKVLGNTGFVNAQATSGGADINDFDNNLMSKKCTGLYAVGEVLDVDGDCGGYNLQWAWSSANAVCKGLIKQLLEK